MRFEENINLNFGVLSNREKSLAKYILNHYNEISIMSIEELSKKANISCTGITRFVKKIGYSGFVNFKLEIAKDTVGYEESESEPADSNDGSIQSIVSQMQAKKNYTIEQTLLLLKTEQLQQAADLIEKSHNVFIVATGASGIVATDLMYKLIKLNKKAIYVSDTGIQKIGISAMSKEDVAFIISYSGNTESIKDIAKAAKTISVPIISLTSNTKNVIRSLADISIVIPQTDHVDTRIRLSAISSRDAHLFVIDVLFFILLFRNTMK